MRTIQLTFYMSTCLKRFHGNDYETESGAPSLRELLGYMIHDQLLGQMTKLGQRSLKHEKEGAARRIYSLVGLHRNGVWCQSKQLPIKDEDDDFCFLSDGCKSL